MNIIAKKFSYMNSMFFVVFFQLPRMWSWRSRFGRYWKTMTGRKTVRDQPAVYHVSTCFSDQIVLEKIWILIQKCLDLCQLWTVILLEVVLSFSSIILLYLLSSIHCHRYNVFSLDDLHFLITLCSHVTCNNVTGIKSVTLQTWTWWSHHCHWPPPLRWSDQQTPK